MPFVALVCQQVFFLDVPELLEIGLLVQQAFALEFLPLSLFIGEF